MEILFSNPAQTDFHSVAKTWQMKKLKDQIEERLKVKTSCIVFETDLNAIWPRKVDSKRIEAIRKFAKENNLSVTIHDPGIRVVFRKLD